MFKKFINFLSKNAPTLAAVFIGSCTFKAIVFLHDSRIESFASDAYNLVLGKPHWIAYQNRLAGPTTVYLLNSLGISLRDSLLTVIFFSTIALALLLDRYLKAFAADLERRILLISTFMFLYIVLQHNWYYVWDNYDLILFTMFAFGILKNKSERFFLILFFVAYLKIFNNYKYRYAPHKRLEGKYDPLKKHG